MNARPMMVTQQTLRNLAVGDKFFVRVAAVSSAGAGPPAVLERLIHIQETIGKAHPCSQSFPGTLANGWRKGGQWIESLPHTHVHKPPAGAILP